MLKATHVTKKFGELMAVDDLSFHVRDGQIYGIAGPNGAGKSTVFNLITGNYGYEGKIEFQGKRITGLPPPTASPWRVSPVRSRFRRSLANAYCHWTITSNLRLQGRQLDIENHPYQAFPPAFQDQSYIFSLLQKVSHDPRM